MEVLLIKNEQDLIFKSKSSSVLRKHKKKQPINSFAFNPVESDIVANPKLSNLLICILIFLQEVIILLLYQIKLI